MNRTIRHLKLIALACAAALSLSTCQDFFGTADLKAIIKDDVETATAESVSVTIQAADKTSMGTPSPIGLQSFKIGFPYPISTTVGDDYTFLKWINNGDPGDITVANPDASSTTITINKVKPGLIVQPTFDRRPYITIWDPSNGNVDYTNTATAVTFNEPLDPSSLVLAEDGSVQVTTNSYTDTSDPIEHIENRLVLTLSVDHKKVIITPASSSPYDPYHYVSITFTTAVHDALGNAMANDAFSSWKTNNGSDTQAPAISKFAITNASGIQSIASAVSCATNGNGIYLNIIADDNQAIPYIKINEIPCDEYGSPSGAPPTMTESSSFSSGTPFPLTLAATSDGYTKLQISVADISKNWTTVTGDVTDTKIVQLDTISPSGYSATIDQPAINNANKTAVSFTFAGAEVGTTYSYTFSTSGGSATKTGTGTIASANQQLTGIDLSTLQDGTITLKVTLTDAALNAGSPYSAATKEKDTFAPSGYTVTIDSAINNANKTAASFTFAGAEVGTTYSYMFSTSGGSATKAGTGTIASADEQVTAIDLSTLQDGTITLRVTLTDEANNTGSEATNTATKDIVPPSPSIIAPADGASVGATSVMTIDAAGGTLTAKIGTNAVAAYTSGSTNISALAGWTAIAEDGDVVVTVYSTDAAGNVGSTSRTFKKDTTAAVLTVSTVSIVKKTGAMTGPALTITTCSDANGIIRIHYWASDGTAAKPGTFNTKDIALATTGPLTSIELSSIGNVSFGFQLVDAAGNLGGGGGTLNYVYCAYSSDYSGGVSKSLLSPTSVSASASASLATSFSTSHHRSTAFTLPLVTERVSTAATWLSPSPKDIAAGLPAATDSFRAAAVSTAEQSWAKAPVTAHKPASAAVVPVKAPVAPRNAEQAAIAMTRSAAAGVDATAAARNWLRADSRLVVFVPAVRPGAGSGAQGTQSSGTRAPAPRGGEPAPFSVLAPTPVDGKRKEDA